MRRVILQTKDGSTYYGEPYRIKDDINSKRYLLNKKVYYLQDIREVMSTAVKNHIALLDLANWEIEDVNMSEEE